MSLLFTKINTKPKCQNGKISSFCLHCLLACSWTSGLNPPAGLALLSVQTGLSTMTSSWNTLWFTETPAQGNIPKSQKNIENMTATLTVVYTELLCSDTKPLTVFNWLILRDGNSWEDRLHQLQIMSALPVCECARLLECECALFTVIGFYIWVLPNSVNLMCVWISDV